MYGRDAATSRERDPKPLAARPARTSRTNAGSCARESSSTVAGAGSRISKGRPRRAHEATTCAGFAALGDPEPADEATILGV